MDDKIKKQFEEIDALIKLRAGFGVLSWPQEGRYADDVKYRQEIERKISAPFVADYAPVDGPNPRLCPKNAAERLDKITDFENEALNWRTGGDHGYPNWPKWYGNMHMNRHDIESEIGKAVADITLRNEREAKHKLVTQWRESGSKLDFDEWEKVWENVPPIDQPEPPQSPKWILANLRSKLSRELWEEAGRPNSIQIESMVPTAWQYPEGATDDEKWDFYRTKYIYLWSCHRGKDWNTSEGRKLGHAHGDVRKRIEKRVKKAKLEARLGQEMPSREELIMLACRTLMAKPGLRNFTLTGKPRVFRIEQEIGMDITWRERNAAWKRIKETS